MQFCNIHLNAILMGALETGHLKCALVYDKINWQAPGKVQETQDGRELVDDAWSVPDSLLVLAFPTPQHHGVAGRDAQVILVTATGTLDPEFYLLASKHGR